MRECKLKQKCHSIYNKLAKVNQLTATRPKWKPSPQLQTRTAYKGLTPHSTKA